MYICNYVHHNKLPIAVPLVVITDITISADDGLVRSIEDSTNPCSSLIVIDVSLKQMIVAMYN